ncbi:hemagglutinin/amebocyte aggregation factor-like [Porites lutea]|uniref:hemagglutinin/amebocyte aggregation factor-like n=1 Tax=Porites lutea TaxID=51062 RepID=UPI003CC513D7
MPKMTTMKFLLLLMVVELTLLHRSEGNPFLWGHYKPHKPHCDSSRPPGIHWANLWQQTFVYSCPKGYSLSRWYSIHRNCKEDRIHHFECRKVNEPDSAHCKWTSYVNTYDNPVKFKCGNNGFVSGVRSEYSSYHKDRRFCFLCCNEPRLFPHDCKSTPLQNNWDAVLNYRVPNGYTLAGVNSHHDNSKEDRRWAFEICKFLSCQ